MTANAEQQIISVASQKETYMNVQQIVNRQTKELTVSAKYPLYAVLYVVILSERRIQCSLISF